MTPSQCVGYALNQTSSITAIVSTRIYHGLRPVASITPCINYFQMGGGTRQYGTDRAVFTINCRAATANTALELARLVTDVFHGTSGTGIHGTLSSFTIIQAAVLQSQGLIPETEDQIYNAPVDIQIVYPTQR